MVSIKHEIWIDAPAKRVFELLSSAEGISTWWDKQIQKQTPEGVVLEHSPGPEHGVVRFLVLRCEADLFVKWRCISEHPDNVPASEWTDTEISFHLGERSSSRIAMEKWAVQIPIQTVLRLEHSGWAENSRYLPFCNYAWADVLTKLANKAVENNR